MVGAPVFSLRDIVKRWPGMPGAVLDGVSLRLAEGEAVGVHGRNGSGKTTLLRVAAGLITPDAGVVDLQGSSPEASRREFQRRIGFVSAGNGALFARLTVDHHLAFGARLALLDANATRDACATVVDDFALDELRGKRVDRLSSGQRQRLRLALGLLHSPAVILLDEPSTSLDEPACRLLEGTLERRLASGAAAIICSPSPSADGLRLDRSLLVRDGSLVEG
ncbi:MAG: type transport system ATP-binding protein [Solirubrobacterales bacterium]|jgi:ABC-2 type transport system ATP-binding protein|nr:type transport system ATP-binding protein [Solirubrobacterales bacterium]